MKKNVHAQGMHEHQLRLCRHLFADIGMHARSSQHGIHLLTECREIGIACAAKCELHGNMEHCEKTASICRDYGELCAEEMV